MSARFVGVAGEPVGSDANGPVAPTESLAPAGEESPSSGGERSSGPQSARVSGAETLFELPVEPKAPAWH